LVREPRHNSARRDRYTVVFWANLRGLKKKTAFLVALAALPASAPGQVLSFSARSDLVVFSATAVDGKGRLVTDLRREEFRIVEEGRAQPIAQFYGGRGLPARILLLVDASGSMGEESKVANARWAAGRVLEALAPEDQVAVAGFDSRYWGIVAFTRDREAIRKGMETIEPFGSTALHDALDKAARDIASHGEGRRAIVVLTDGVDTSSQKTADEVIARSRALDVPIYAVSVVSPLDDPNSPSFLGKKEAAEAAAATETLARYAELSGGSSFRVSNPAALRFAADRIANELKHQYRLGWDAPNGPARFRRVVVQSTRKGVTVRTRSGYEPPS
jgi:Ca-activated chloride channel family protein